MEFWEKMEIQETVSTVKNLFSTNRKKTQQSWLVEMRMLHKKKFPLRNCSSKTHDFECVKWRAFQIEQINLFTKYFAFVLL